MSERSEVDDDEPDQQKSDSENHVQLVLFQQTILDPCMFHLSCETKSFDHPPYR